MCAEASPGDSSHHFRPALVVELGRPRWLLQVNQLNVICNPWCCVWVGSTHKWAFSARNKSIQHNITIGGYTCSTEHNWQNKIGWRSRRCRHCRWARYSVANADWSYPPWAATDAWPRRGASKCICVLHVVSPCNRREWSLLGLISIRPNANENDEDYWWFDTWSWNDQRAQWLLSIPAWSDVNGAMQELTELDYATSEQHKDVMSTRQTKCNKDLNRTLPQAWQLITPLMLTGHKMWNARFSSQWKGVWCWNTRSRKWRKLSQWTTKCLQKLIKSLFM